jgi:hypothetical protein
MKNPRRAFAAALKASMKILTSLDPEAIPQPSEVTSHDWSAVSTASDLGWQVSAKEYDGYGRKSK